MKKDILKQKSNWIVLMFCVLFLASCQEDTWMPASLDFSFSSTTSSRGYFSSQQQFYPEDIFVKGSSGYISDFRFTGTSVEITGDLRAGDVIHGLVIDIDGVGTYTFPDIKVYHDGEVITIANNRINPDFYDFMLDAFRYMKAQGHQYVYVSGNLYDYNGFAVSRANVEVDVYNDLDVRMSR